MNDLQINFTFSQTPKQVFDAVIAVNRWWSEMLEGKSAHVGDEFIYRHAAVHYSKHRITEVHENRKVVWLTLESRLSFVVDSSEWNGSEVIFEIKQQADKTILIFTHKGLHPGLACYEGCSTGWNFYLDSLRKLIITGEGHPDKIEALDNK